ncbi:MAG: ATP-dependent Clp protease proteolytic subunit [Fuerstiella sp.]|jgi:ATP-dependent protease ClpP protease subunit
MDKEPALRKLGAYPAAPHGNPRDENRGPWELVISGDLSDRQSDLLSRLVELPLRSKGVIYFDSAGGSVYAGLALATLIKTRELNATGVVVGECSSAALMPFAACQKRFVTAVSTLLFHPMRWQSEEDVRLEEATEWARHFKELEADLDQLLVKLFPVDAAMLQKWTRPGRFVTGRELAAAKLAVLFDPFTEDKPWQTIRTA